MKTPATNREPTSGCMWGCVTMLGMGVALLLFGKDVVGKACLVIGPACVLAAGLRTGRFGWIVNDRELRREESSRWFWVTAAAFAVLTAVLLFYFLKEALGLAAN